MKLRILDRLDDGLIAIPDTLAVVNNRTQINFVEWVFSAYMLAVDQQDTNDTQVDTTGTVFCQSEFPLD